VSSRSSFAGQPFCTQAWRPAFDGSGPSATRNRSSRPPSSARVMIQRTPTALILAHLRRSEGLSRFGAFSLGEAAQCFAWRDIPDDGQGAEGMGTEPVSPGEHPAPGRVVQVVDRQEDATHSDHVGVGGGQE
jgi:hypothetical protein